MPFRFYLSYAPADYSEDIQRFFEHLSAIVSIRLQRADAAELGFFDPAASDSDWGTDPRAAEALRTSQMMIALTSEGYFNSERARRERRIFELRQRLASSGSSEVSQTIVSRSFPARGFVSGNGLDQANERRSIVGFVDDYKNLLLELSELVVSVSNAALLPELEAVPDFAEVQNAFKPAFRAVVVESDELVRQLVFDMLTGEGFEVAEYERPADLDRHLEGKMAIDPVDLFVIDLGRGRKEEAAALDLIYTIKRIKAKAGLMAMSANFSEQNRLEARRNGAEDLLAKPFLGDIRLTAKRMVRLAETGKDRRLFMAGFRSESSDRERPVFLSYAGKDNDRDNIAIYLKSQIEAIPIGVWYSPEMQPPEDPDGPGRVFAGIAQARLFLPLITPEYLSSIPCMAELITFLIYQTKNPALKLMPVLTDSKLENFNWIQPLIGEHRYLRPDKFDNDLTAILGWIQKNLNGSGSVR